MEFNKNQINILMQYLSMLDKYGHTQIRNNFDEQNDIVSKNLSNKVIETCVLLNINKPVAFELSEKISSTYELIKWAYMEPLNRYINRQNRITDNALRNKNVDKMRLAAALNHNIDDQGLSNEMIELEKKISAIVTDRISYLITNANINNQNYFYFQSKIESTILGEVEAYTSKLCENSKEVYDLVKKRIRSLTDMITFNVQSFVDKDNLGFK